MDIVYFIPDERKSGGEYHTFTGSVKKISLAERVMTLNNGEVIHLDDISCISGSIFADLMEASQDFSENSCVFICQKLIMDINYIRFDKNELAAMRLPQSGA